MDRCALFVDAGYVLADGAMAVHGTRHRESVSWNYAGLLQFLETVARDRTGLPLLRCYWYEATVEGRRSAEHDALADLPGVKLRLGRMRPGRREGVESEIHRDLTTLARNGALQEALLVSAEEDLEQVIADVQDLGVRVTLVHITVDGNWTISRSLRQECDDVVEVNEAHLRPYVELVVGAEPLHEDGRDAVGAHSGRPLTNGHGQVGPLGHQQALPAGSHAAPPEIYTGPVIAEYQRAAQPTMNGQPGSPQPADLSGPAATAPPAPQAPQPGQPQVAQPGQPQAPQGEEPPMPRRRQPRTSAPAPAGSTRPEAGVVGSSSDMATQPTMPAVQPGPAGQQPVAVGQQGPPAPAAGAAVPTAQPAAAPDQETRASRVMPQPSARQQDMSQQGMSQHGMPQHGMPQQGMPQPAVAPAVAAQPGLAPSAPAAPLPQRTPASPARPRTEHLRAAPVPDGMPPAPQPGPAGPPGPPRPPGSTGQHPVPGQPGMQPSAAQYGHPGMAPPPAPPPGAQAGQPVYPAPPAYHGPGPDAPAGPAVPGRSGVPGAPGAAGATGGAPGVQPQTGPPQAVAGQQPAPALAALPDAVMGQAGPAGSPPPGEGVPGAPPPQQASGVPPAYPPAAPTDRSARGSHGQRAAQQAPGSPSRQPEGETGAAFRPQQGPYGGPQPAESHVPMVQQTSVSLPDAVQAAHGEGFNFGHSVAHEAPALWLEAVLARKPRMPSDLEAKLLQDSALPIDSLLHDEVRHALRRGFWDALERARS